MNKLNKSPISIKACMFQTLNTQIYVVFFHSKYSVVNIQHTFKNISGLQWMIE